MEEGEEVGDGGAEGPAATGDGGHAAESLTPDADGAGLAPCWNQRHMRISESL